MFSYGERFMERIIQIINHPLYVECLHKIKNYEKERIFCKHDMVHFLDVCRIAEIIWLRYCLDVQGLDKDDYEKMSSEQTKEYIYATGILHDIGRWQEYEEGIRHEITSADLASRILCECGYNEQEIEEIRRAILNHRNSSIKDENSLSGWIYQADKKSRACFACKAEKMCDWSKAKKNLRLM